MDKVKAQVFHRKEMLRTASGMPAFNVEGVVFNLDDYTFVGEVSAATLDEVYCSTQNINDSWTKNENVRRTVGEHRSSSIGDVFLFGSDLYFVDGFGFKEIEMRGK